MLCIECKQRIVSALAEKTSSQNHDYKCIKLCQLVANSVLNPRVGNGLATTVATNSTLIRMVVQ